MSASPCPVYVFRCAGFAQSNDTIVGVAPLDCVAAVFGSGGPFGSDGLSAAFGGAAVFRNEETGAYFVGIWGARNASRFRRQLRAHMPVIVLKEAPDARLCYRETREKPSKDLAELKEIRVD